MRNQTNFRTCFRKFRVTECGNQRKPTEPNGNHAQFGSSHPKVLCNVSSKGLVLLYMAVSRLLSCPRTLVLNSYRFGAWGLGACGLGALGPWGLGAWGLGAWGLGALWPWGQFGALGLNLEPNWGPIWDQLGSIWNQFGTNFEYF